MSHEPTTPSLQDLVTLAQRMQVRVQRRVDRLRWVAEMLAPKGRRWLRYARWARTAIIALGALATADIAAQQLLMASLVPYSNGFFVGVGIAIATIGGLDTAYKPGEVGTEVGLLRARCSAAVNEIDRDFGRHVERVGVSPEALDRLYALAERADAEIAAVENRLAQLGVPLRQPQAHEPEEELTSAKGEEDPS